MTESRFVEADGVRLHVEIDAHESARSPVVVLHGFTGSTRSMAGVAAALCTARTTVRIDLLGHGRSDAPDETAPYTMGRCVDQVCGVVDALGLESPHWLGYSMGGRVAISLAARHAERVRSLALVGVSPGLADAAARRQRVAADEALADDLLSAGLPAFVDRWMALPLFASQARLGARALEDARRQRLENRPHGLARSLRGLGTGAMPPLHRALNRLGVPIALVVGAEDEKFRGLARDMAVPLPDAHIHVIPHAGHAAHLENPEAFAEVVRAHFAAADALEPLRSGAAAPGGSSEAVPRSRALPGGRRHALGATVPFSAGPLARLGVSRSEEGAA